MLENMELNTNEKLIIALSLDYGAKEYLWYSDFYEFDELLKWWDLLKTTDIYTTNLNEIINTSQITPVDSDNKRDLFYSGIPRLMLENDECSYIFFKGNRYEFKKK